MEDYLSKLNDQQRAAVEYCDGPQLVIAGAGSGKTRVLTYKIVHLLHLGLQPWRILALTFTNKAAKEMRERIQGLVGEKLASRLWMGTFHSIFARILRINADKIGFKSDFTIYDASDSRALVKMIIKDMELDEKVYRPNTVAAAISNAKNALVGPAQYAADRSIREADRRARRDRLHEIYTAYMARCRVAQAMDFDDLLYYTSLLLRDHPEVKRHYQEFFQYVLVDEYQDTNFAQHMIISQLCDLSQRLCVVGDDAQSIYSFRGANIRNILNLSRAYPSLRIFKLEQNYRSTQHIIEAAGSLIEKNTEQMRKHVYSLGDEGEKVMIAQSYSDIDEAGLVASHIARRKVERGQSFNDFAILYRTNAQSRVLEEALRDKGIPYRIYGGMSFYQRKEVRDAVAYMRLAVNPDDDEALKRVINYPARGIGDTTMNKLSHAAMAAGVSIWAVLSSPESYQLNINRGTSAKLQSFKQLIDSLAANAADGSNAAEAANFIVSTTGLMTQFLSDNTPENISRQQNLTELLNSARAWVDEHLEQGDEDHVFLADFLTQASLATDQDRGDEGETDRVTLMTIHAAKGLEFSNIFVVGAEEDLLPSAMAKDSAMEIEEERRLLYVAITRAKTFCMITYAGQRYVNGQPTVTRPSRFLRDIDPRHLTLAMGTPNTFDADQRRARSSFHTASTWGARGPQTASRSGQRPGSPWGATITPTPAPAAGARVQTNFRSGPSAADRTVPGARLHTADELTAGMRIEHPRFGAGSIIDIDTSMPDARIRVAFDNVEAKTLLLKFAKFAIKG